MNGPRVHCGLFVGDPFYKLSFMCLTEFFLQGERTRSTPKFEKSLNAAGKAEVEHQFMQK